MGLLLASSDPVTVYLQTRDEYFGNAEVLLGKGEERKASEMLWGAIAQGVKALAASRNIILETHSRLFEFVREVARECKRRDIYETFLELQVLHGNFYDTAIPAEALLSYFRRARTFLLELEGLIRRDVLE